MGNITYFGRAIDNQLQGDLEVPAWGTIYTDIQVFVTRKAENVASGKFKEFLFQPSKGEVFS